MFNAVTMDRGKEHRAGSKSGFHRRCICGCTQLITDDHLGIHAAQCHTDGFRFRILGIHITGNVPVRRQALRTPPQQFSPARPPLKKSDRFCQDTGPYCAVRLFFRCPVRLPPGFLLSEPSMPEEPSAGRSHIPHRATRKFSDVTRENPRGPCTPAMPTRFPPGIVKYPCRSSSS